MAFNMTVNSPEPVNFGVNRAEVIQAEMWTPEINSGYLSWTKVRQSVAPAPVYVIGPAGPQGIQGVPGQDGTDGTDGENGADGVSPVVTITQITGGHTITITDATGAHTANVMNGLDGSNGNDGADGVSPTVAITPIQGGNIISITDKDGTHSATVTDGIDGTNGTDGVSPTVSISAITGGHRVTITDATGAHTADILNGAPGANGQDGTDGTDGADGGYYSPAVDSAGNLSWTASKTGMPAVQGANIKGPQGATGPQGQQGIQGPPGADAKIRTYSASIATGWSGSSAPYSKAVTITGILATDKPVIDLVPSSTFSTAQSQLEQWAYVYRAVTSANTITFYATDKPTIALPIQVRA